LDKAKKLLKKRSYDEVIRAALKVLLDVPDSLFGLIRIGSLSFARRIGYSEMRNDLS